MLNIIFCGDRNWSNIEIIAQIMLTLQKEIGIFTVIEGEAKGADVISRACAETIGLPIKQFPANWTKYHKSAGPIRNRQMVKEGQTNAVVAFHNDIQNSKGTKDMVKYALELELPVHLVSEEIGLNDIEEFVEKLKNLSR